MSKITEVTMWRDADNNYHTTEEDAVRAANKIDTRLEYDRKRRIVENHVDLAFDDWLKNTNRSKAFDMRQGAIKLIWYFLHNDLLKPGMFEDGV